MVIVDEKSLRMQPPPSYANSVSPPPPFPHHRASPKLSTLPPHLLLQIVYSTFPQQVFNGHLGNHRKVLYWMATHLRLVNRSFYIACMHVLRSTYLPAYDTLIRSPYTSDPFPLSTPTPISQSPLRTIQRETQVLDLFIALKVREDVWMDDSELHLEREESFKDLFDLNQPRSRLEDLIRKYGEREGVVTIGPTVQNCGNLSPSPTSGVFRTNNTASEISTVSRKGKSPMGFTPLQFSLLSISFSSRRVGLVLTGSGRKRTIVEVPRIKEQKLEVSAKKLVSELKVWLASAR